MTMTMKRIAVATMLAFTTAMVAPAATLAAAAPAPAAPSALSIPIVGNGPAGSGVTFAGNFQLQRFASQNGVLTAIGVLTGTVTGPNGVIGTVLKNVALPAAIAQSTCEILHLDLGPLSLDLLGLHIDLSRVVLDITAEAGAGNLLGNLLCGVANLLNGGTGLAGILNQILALLG